MFPVGVDAALVTDDPLYQLVPSVRAGHGVVLDGRLLVQAFSSGTARGLSYAVDRAVPLFAGAMAR